MIFGQNVDENLCTYLLIKNGSTDRREKQINAIPNQSLSIDFGSIIIGAAGLAHIHTHTVET